jgi:hypothetical protein
LIPVRRMANLGLSWFGDARLPRLIGDRAQALEAAIERQWQRSMRQVLGSSDQDNFFARPLASLTKSGQNLVLVGVCVETGQPVLFTNLPIRTPRTEQPEYVHFSDLTNGKDVTVAQAVVASARFPLISPPAAVNPTKASPASDCRRIMDGGFYENSSIRSVEFLIAAAASPGRDLSETLRSFDAALNKRTRYIVFTHAIEDFYRWNFALEALSLPAVAMNSSTQVGREFVRRFVKATGLDSDDCEAQITADRVYRLFLRESDFQPKLGWVMSADARARIRGSLNRPCQQQLLSELLKAG